ncbi:MAG TPA: FecR domain-containing protein [Steroidobacteraceae bacterium]|jgi:transmembrane sensor|nr:FecR domain-containing protein [Steroidobacteraceae bacterium]
MTASADHNGADEPPASPEEQAAAAYIRQQSGHWTAREQAELNAWLADPAHAESYRKVQLAWQAVGIHSASPPLLVVRGAALRRARSPRRRRGAGFYAKSALAASIVLLLGVALERILDTSSEVTYRTGTGEQQLIELADSSRIALDARTTLRVRMNRDVRMIELLGGQAQFIVAHEPRRPFVVEVGRDAIIAVGTSFNVQYFDASLQVDMVTGKVVVETPGPSKAPAALRKPTLPAADRTINLGAGDELSVGPTGQAVVERDTDVAAALAWRRGKIIFRNTPLDEAVSRLNRYSTLQLRITDPLLAQQRISGVFELGDTVAFAEAAQASLSLVAHQRGPDLVLLSPAP